MGAMDADWGSRYLSAWNRHSVEDILGYMTPDCSYTDVALNESHVGTDDIRHFLLHMEANFSSDYSFEVGPGVATDSGYAQEWVMHGTHDRASPQLPATGKPYSVRGVSVGEFRDGKIARNTDYWSLAEFLSQIGMFPTPASV
jgi:steroid delta-isomerase-like uncharacterized protein